MSDPRANIRNTSLRSSHLLDYVVVWKTGEKTKLTDRLEQARSTFKENLLAQAIELEEQVEEGEEEEEEEEGE
ncbi:unnamed protein product [Schistocephalus solidus]|uniref:Anoctamin dimerisation domain-containing protein n=1 Tax=Schistocephalus solidus TaxID=70667 RepID=A0A183SMD8_SCHSO|nr:unnamed protein product [Schistocephalus solidus]